MADVVAESGSAVVLMHNRDDIDPDLDVEADLTVFFIARWRLPIAPAFRGRASCSIRA